MISSSSTRYDRMEKQIIRDNELSIDFVSLSPTKPIKFKYKEITSPIFNVRAGSYTLSTNKPHTMLVMTQLDAKMKTFIENLDEMIPDLAYKRREDWFTSDLFEVREERFHEGYKKSISEYGFSIYLGLINGNDLPVSTFIKDSDSGPRPLPNSFQELAWSRFNGQITILAQITGLWIKEESFGLSWKVLQILYKPKFRFPKGSTVLTTDQIQSHAWITPSDEIDPVELPDEVQEHEENDEDRGKEEAQEKEAMQDAMQEATQEGGTNKEEIINTATFSLSTPYNALLETDD